LKLFRSYYLPFIALFAVDTISNYQITFFSGDS